eukprot:scaffold75715_cov54-Cyclotella_meneghiniana.AAC.1
MTIGSELDGQSSSSTGSSGQSNIGNPRKSSCDPEANNVHSSSMNNIPPDPPRSIETGYSSRRSDPIGLSHDDPGGLHYAPGMRNHSQQPPSGGPTPSVDSSQYEELPLQSSRDETVREDQDRGSSTMISTTGKGLSLEASQTTGREKEESYYSRGLNASCSLEADGTSTQPNEKRIMENKLSTLPSSATRESQHNEMPLANEHQPSPSDHEPIPAVLPTLLNSGANLVRQELLGRNNRPGIETIDSTSPIPPSQDADLLQYQTSTDDKASKTDRAGIETIDDSTSPIPSSQDASLLQYQVVNNKPSKTDRAGIETIDGVTS